MKLIAVIKTCFAATIILGILPLGHAQTIPRLVYYQGTLTDSSGNPLRSGTYGVAFRIWPNNAVTPAEPLIWGQDCNVAIVSGIFNVIRGAPGGTPLTNTGLSFAFGEPNRFLGLTVTRGTNGSTIANAQELVPRQQVLSAPYAMVAQQAATLVGGVTTTQIVDGAVTLLKLAHRLVGTNVPVGGIAITPEVMNATSTSPALVAQ